VQEGRCGGWFDSAGFLEVMAMQTNNTPLFDSGQLIESLCPGQRLPRDYSLDIRYAMNCDINGQNWPLADVLLSEAAEVGRMTCFLHSW
jgi:hypothetical protein